MSSSNSSNLYGNVNVSDITNNGARLIMSHPISGFSGGVSGVIGDDGVTAGDVIRYDVIPDSPSFQKYTKAQADVAEHSEVIGVIETIENDVVGVVLSGQIKFPSGRFATADHLPNQPTIGGASGGNDVYFLSEVTAGGVQNLGPTSLGNIAKPVLQVADDGVFNAHVVNYIGYQIGGNVVGDVETYNQTGSVDKIVDFTGDRIIDNKTHWFRLDEETWLSLSASATEYTSWLYSNSCDTVFGGGIYGLRETLTLSTTPSSNLVGKSVTQKHSNGRVLYRATVTSVDRPNNTITVNGVNIDDTTNTAINADTTKILYHGNTQYTVSSVERVAFALPQYKIKNTTSFKDIKGVSSNLNEIYIMFVKPNWMGSIITVADDLFISNLNVTNKCTFTSEDGTSVSTDIAKILSQINTDINSITSKIGLTATTKDIT